MWCDHVQCVGTVTHTYTHFVRQHAVCSGSVRLWRVRGCRVRLCWSPRWLQSDPPPAPGGSRAAGDTGTVWSRWWQSIVQDTWWSPSQTASGNTSASDRPCRSLSSLCRPGCSGRTGTSDGTETTTVKVYNTSWTRGVSSMDITYIRTRWSNSETLHWDDIKLMSWAFLGSVKVLQTWSLYSN